jgi:hypothetical protein
MPKLGSPGLQTQHFVLSLNSSSQDYLPFFVYTIFTQSLLQDKKSDKLQQAKINCSKWVGKKINPRGREIVDINSRYIKNVSSPLSTLCSGELKLDSSQLALSIF